MGVELGFRLEELGSAPGAQIDAWGVGVPVLAGEGPLGALFAKDVELHGGQLVPPLGFGLVRRFRLLHARNLPVSASHQTAGSRCRQMCRAPKGRLRYSPP